MSVEYMFAGSFHQASMNKYGNIIICLNIVNAIEMIQIHQYDSALKNVWMINNYINKCLSKRLQYVYWPAGIHVLCNYVGVKEPWL